MILESNGSRGQGCGMRDHLRLGARTQTSHCGRGLTSGSPCTQPRDQYPPANPANHLRCSDLAAKL